MHSHLMASLFKQMQEGNKDTDEEEQDAEQEQAWKPPLSEELVEEPAAPATTIEVKLHKLSLKKINLAYAIPTNLHKTKPLHVHNVQIRTGRFTIFARHRRHSQAN